jgi:hypothetical protein
VCPSLFLLRLILATANHLRHDFLNLSSSDSELNKHRTKLSASLTNIANDMFFSKSPEKDSMVSASKQGIFLPMQNMKHNVTEKVAQVGH